MTQYLFGHLKDGSTVTAYCLENSQGAQAVILDYGCIVQSLCVPNAQGTLTDVVLGYDTLSEYEDNDAYVGAAIGRVANRIGNGEFMLNGRTYRLARNDGENHLHGGTRGFDKFIWKATTEENTVVFSRVSPDGEENYPGNLTVDITYILTESNELRIIYDAASDADTIVNLTNHSYFNLAGKGSVLDHDLQVFAEQFTENDEHCLPTGKLLKTAGTPFDFSKPKKIGQDINSSDSQLINGHGYDHNFILSNHGDLKKAAELHSHQTGISMTVCTTLPGIQVYSGNFLSPRKGKKGSLIDCHGGICLETQVWPNATAYTHFPSAVLRKDERFHTETCYKFEIEP